MFTGLRHSVLLCACSSFTLFFIATFHCFAVTGCCRPCLRRVVSLPATLMRQPTPSFISASSILLVCHCLMPTPPARRPSAIARLFMPARCLSARRVRRLTCSSMLSSMFIPHTQHLSVLLAVPFCLIFYSMISFHATSSPHSSRHYAHSYDFLRPGLPDFCCRCLTSLPLFASHFDLHFSIIFPRHSVSLFHACFMFPAHLPDDSSPPPEFPFLHSSIPDAMTCLRKQWLEL